MTPYDPEPTTLPTMALLDSERYASRVLPDCIDWPSCTPDWTTPLMVSLLPHVGKMSLHRGSYSS